MSSFKIVMSPFVFYMMSPFNHKSSNGLIICINLSFLTCVYRWVVLILKCPKIYLIYLMSIPFSNKFVAKLCLNVWGLLLDCVVIWDKYFFHNSINKFGIHTLTIIYNDEVIGNVIKNRIFFQRDVFLN